MFRHLFTDLILHHLPFFKFFGVIMGLLSNTVSITRYKIEGEISSSIMDTVSNGLKNHKIIDIDKDVQEMAVGWTTFENPYLTDFETTSFIYGNYIVFSLRIDKKSIPSKMVNKIYSFEVERKLKESDREFLSRNEKKQIKDQVIHSLCLRIPPTPNTYDILWNYEESVLWFFSTQKSANEEFETLFTKSFKLTPIRLFPYTIADLMFNLSDKDRDRITQLSPTKFTE